MRRSSGSGEEELGKGGIMEGGRRTYQDRSGRGSDIDRGRGRYGVAMVGSAPQFSIT